MKKLKKIFDLGVILGRFQTFHLGHCSLIDLSLELCNRTAVFIGSAQASWTENNPFDFETRKKLIQAVYGDKVEIYGINDRPFYADDSGWGRLFLSEVEKNCGKKPDLIIRGNDSCRNSWFDSKDISGTDELIVNRSKIDISGTQLRFYMEEDLEEKWKEFVHPNLHPFYNELRNILLSIKLKEEVKK